MENNDRSIIEKKKKKMKGVSVPENGHKSGKMKSIVQDLSEKVMACMELLDYLHSTSTSHLIQKVVRKISV